MLEQILKRYFNLEENYTRQQWYNAYNKLLSLIDELEEIGVIKDKDSIIDELDMIDNIS